MEFLYQRERGGIRTSFLKDEVLGRWVEDALLETEIVPVDEVGADC